MPGRLVALLAAALGLGGAVAPAQDMVADQILVCRDHESASLRLACYDALDLPDDRPILRISGQGSTSTPAFTIRDRAMLRFASDDAVFVAYLLDDGDAVVRNLHHGGAGGGEYVIENSGTYSLQINASGGWSISVTDLTVRGQAQH